MSKKLGLDKQYQSLNVNRNYLQFPVINSVKPKPTKPTKMNKGGGADMSTKQKAIAAKAPPPNVLDGKDLAVLRAEKAKGRGMGLKDEKLKPGKVMKARTGKDVKVKRIGKNEDELTEFEKRRLKLKAGD